MIKKKNLSCRFIRINPDAADFSINRVINLVYMLIKQSTKKSLIHDLSKKQLELEFEKNH